MDPIIAQIRALARTSDEVGRLELQQALRKVQMEIQTSKDFLYNLANSVGDYSVYILLAAH
jgi:hypothetical protein